MAPAFGAGSFAVGALASAGLLLALRSVARPRVARAALAIALGFVWSAQAIALRYYRAPIDAQVAAGALDAWGDVAPALRSWLSSLVLGGIVAAIAEGVLLAAMGNPLHFQRTHALIGAVLALLGIASGRATTPEVRAMSIVPALFAAPSPRPSGVVPLPLLPSRRADLPSVLFVWTESVRASDHCAAPVEKCPIAPEMNALLPDRIALSEMRSLSSYTTISIAGIMTGRTQMGTREEIALAPTAFDFLRVIVPAGAPPDRLENKPIRVAYIGAHYKSGVWERGNIDEGLDRFESTETILARGDAKGKRGYDTTVADLALRAIAELRPPIFLVVHFYDTHVPYTFDPSDAPFVPYTHAVSWETMPDLHRAYQNAIHEQDRSIARVVRAFEERLSGSPRMVMFTSDHGEAFGEHHAIHHGQGLYDEQIHVPAFVVARDGGLSPEQIAALRANAGGPASHADWLPTLLDAMGVWDNAAMNPLRGAIVGRSLLRPISGPPRAIPMTACNASFPCPRSAWGMLGDTHALVADVYDDRFRCVPLDDSGAWVEGSTCDALRVASQAFFPLLPNGNPNR